MGAGASAGLAAATRAASDDGLAEVLKELPLEAREKLTAALTQVAEKEEELVPVSEKASLPPRIEELLAEQFHLVNISGTGHVDLEEMLACLKASAELMHTKYCEKYFKSVFEKMDTKKAGNICLEDFVKYHIDMLDGNIEALGGARRVSKRITKVNRLLRVQAELSTPIVAALKELFNSFDIDHSGHLTVETDKIVSEALGNVYDENSKASFLENAKNGQVSLDEFMEYFKHQMLDAIIQEAGGMEGAVDVIKQQATDVKEAVASAKETKEKA